MNKRDKAVARITEECTGKEYLIPFEEYLTSICTNDVIAEKILDENKTLGGCFDAMKTIAKKRAKNGFAYISPEEGFSIIREYYGITDEDMRTAISLVKPQADVIDISDLL